MHVYNIKTSNKNKIKIIHTYAPHMGSNPGERDKYCKEISGIAKQINKNDCANFRSVDNGQIGKNENNKNIGELALSGKMRVNGDKLDKITNKYDTNIANTNYNAQNKDTK